MTSSNAAVGQTAQFKDGKRVFAVGVGASAAPFRATMPAKLRKVPCCKTCIGKGCVGRCRF
jgi:hypothetical protein